MSLPNLRPEEEYEPDQPEPVDPDQFDMARSARTGLGIDWWAVLLAAGLGLLVWSKLLPPIPW